ncbi:hypothetical protein FHX44_113102 [Pseudonocardia hierapolitana]|uniref:Uncharacterized protein n=1 Tax=Pseudonocardia hierapolitana TaxID=1128676 RepID=A0A561SQQ8_9PSEU|nr:hypothetical protein [Pseudonocardia hierapolitana]TWF77197.1 hypothetical protein FHX44_113102 [Pseudonocardia hierapolitana]
MDLGSVADWVNAAGTVCAFGAALFAGIVAVGSYRTQQRAIDRQLTAHAEDERRRARSERQWQASKVAVWVYRGRNSWTVHAANSSGLPVYRLTVRIAGEEPPFSVAIERGTQGPTPADTARKLTNALRVVLDQRNALHMDPNKLHVAIAFTDAAGVRWRRDERGKLDEVPDSFDFDDVDERLIDRLVPRHDDRDVRGIL